MPGKAGGRLQTIRGFYRNYVKKHYEEAHRFKAQGGRIAWALSTTPVEILYAFNFYPVWPENYSSVCAALQASVMLAERAEKQGFSKDLCSYCRIGLGSTFDPSGAPEGGLPKPDLLVATSCACDIHLKWFQVVSRKLNVPLLFLDVPYNKSGHPPQGLEDYYVKRYVAELERMIYFLERFTGTKLDQAKLRRIIELSNECSDLWLEVMAYRRAIPCPMGAEDAFSAVFFMLGYAGTEEAVSFYRKLRDEVKWRVENGIGVLEDERFRLAWDNIPLWYNLGFFDYLKGFGAIVAIESFSLTWAGSLNPSKPLESLARKHLANIANSSIDYKKNLFLRLAKEYSLDGVILPLNWGCKHMSIGEVEVKNELQEKLGVPSLILEVDAADPRGFIEAQVKSKVESFIELMKQAKQAKR
ncbi:MAG: 2-hydroxyacyl-CoA dehydratase family protein [Candidatus Nezhaarchaeales archaeon]